jgi:hypothetical protein
MGYSNSFQFPAASAGSQANMMAQSMAVSSQHQKRMGMYMSIGNPHN